MGHKIQVSFSDDQWKLLERLKGSMGNTDAEVIRSVVVAWLSEKSFISTSVKENIRRSGDGQ